MKEALLSAKEIVKTYPDRQEPILNRISIEIYQGDFTIIMGPSGAGKSTLLYALSGMDTLSSGKMQYRDLELTFSNGMIADYRCANFPRDLENKAYIKDHILYHHQALPLGEFAIGTNTTAYVAAKKYDMEDKMPILIAEKMGPHFAVGDTCYSWSEDVPVYNPNGKEIVARDNSVSIRRKEDVSKAYFQCHTDITIPYEELKSITVVTKEGEEIPILLDGRFVLPGTEILNEPLKNL